MREIKFRMWDKIKKCFILPFIPGECVYVLNPSNCEILKFSENGLGKDNTYDIIITQFTGILDSEEKEIYEGDILQNQDGSLIEVKFKTLKLTPSGIGDTRPVLFNDWFIGFQFQTFGKVKIIGNIFEIQKLTQETEK